MMHIIITQHTYNMTVSLITDLVRRHIIIVVIGSLLYILHLLLRKAIYFVFCIFFMVAYCDVFDLKIYSNIYIYSIALYYLCDFLKMNLEVSVNRISFGTLY